MRSVVLLVLIAGLAPPALAQDAPRAQEQSAPVPATSPSPPIDPTKLGVSLPKIQKGLFIAAEREAQSGGELHLEFNVQVYGMAPKIEVLKGVDLGSGGVPGSAPTHRQMMEFVTPAIYRSPTMPVSALALWAKTALWQKFKRARCEEEIAHYRQLLMQGLNVPAPRCTQ
jgi:hypothetical protein